MAFAELSRCGTITSGSVMVPCPWFLEIADTATSANLLDELACRSSTRFLRPITVVSPSRNTTTRSLLTLTPALSCIAHFTRTPLERSM
jgi:hypothetical protein